MLVHGATNPLTLTDATVPGRSTESYFSMLLDQARLAAKRGNYPIAAAAVIRREDHDHVYVASNAMFEADDPIAHAEIVAIRRALRLEELPHDALTRVEMAAIDPTTRSQIVLYSTLEPCPMCTICALTAQVDQIIVAVRDPASGSLSPERVTGLAPIWHQLARNVDVRFCQSSDPTDQVAYLPSPLLSALEELASQGRSSLDGRLLRCERDDLSVP